MYTSTRTEDTSYNNQHEELKKYPIPTLTNWRNIQYTSKSEETSCTHQEKFKERPVHPEEFKGSPVHI